MRRRARIGRTIAALLALGAAAGAAIVISPTGKTAGAAVDRCAAPEELTALGAPLPRLVERLRAGAPVTIVALGSSSTEGYGASRRDLSYPSRLAAALQERFPATPIRVVNRGVGGEVAAQMLARIPKDVVPEHPDLVIWQLGTNSVLRNLDLEAEAELARQGIAALRATGADVMLMDMQYAPAVLVHERFREMERMIAGVARVEDVALFRRFAVMRHWAEDGAMTLPVMLGRDRLHMTDVSYDCLGRQVARAIATQTGPVLALD